jgi:DNA-binding NarL/FixJ family response regulator
MTFLFPKNLTTWILSSRLKLFDIVWSRMKLSNTLFINALQQFQTKSNHRKISNNYLRLWMIRIFLVDDHPMVLEGIKMMLQNSAIVEVVGSAGSAVAALAALKAAPADVALVDINLSDMDGIELCRKLKSEIPSLKILGLSTFKERSYITRMIEAGASGYLLKNATGEELEDAVTIANKGRMYMSLEVAETIARPAPPKPDFPILTSREKEVLALIAEGMTNNEIAHRLFVSPLTVDSHRKNLLAKFGVKNTAAMVKFAMEGGLI